MDDLEDLDPSRGSEDSLEIPRKNIHLKKMDAVRPHVLIYIYIYLLFSEWPELGDIYGGVRVGVPPNHPFIDGDFPWGVAKLNHDDNRHVFMITTRIFQRRFWS